MPPNIVDPFLEVAVDRIVYECNKEVDGNPCHVFDMESSAGSSSPMKRISIGIADGLPGRIEVPSRRIRILHEVNLSKVTVAPPLHPSEFKLPGRQRAELTIDEHNRRFQPGR